MLAKAGSKSADLNYYKPFLDADGGYKDKEGGYFNPKQGTYTDKDGGVVDNYHGYRWKDGSYKSRYGDYYDGPNKTFQLADGEAAKAPAETTPQQARQVLQENVAANGGYEKDFILKAMLERLNHDHPTGGHPLSSPAATLKERIRALISEAHYRIDLAIKAASH